MHPTQLDQATHASLAVKKAFGANTAGKQDTETEVEGNEFNFLCSEEFREFEFEASSGYPSVKGRLKANLKFWRETVGANASVVDVIENGYKMAIVKLH